MPAVAEKQIIIPKMKKVIVPEVVGPNYKRSGYEVEVSPTLARYEDGTFAGEKTQEQALQMLGQYSKEHPEQGRLTLPPMTLLSYLAETQGRESPFFADAFARNKEKKYFWEHTATRITPPEGKDRYPQDSDGRYIGLVWEYQPDKALFVPIAEQRIPQGGGNVNVIVALEPATGIALETTPDFKTKHTTHWYFDPNLKENIVLFGSYWCDVEHGRCFYADARYEPRSADVSCGFRPVRGFFSEMEKLAKTYEDGLREGHEKGLAEGRTEGIVVGRNELMDEFHADAAHLRDFLSKYGV